MKDGWYIVNNVKCLVQKIGKRNCYYNNGWNELTGKEEIKEIEENKKGEKNGNTPN